MKFKYSIIVLTLVSLVVLYGISLFSQPVPILLSAISEYDGQTVIVKGAVTEYRTTTDGSQLITISDTQNSTDPVILFIEGAIDVDYGDFLQATGAVQQYKQQWEVVVSNPRYVILLQKWSNGSYPLWQLAQHPQRYEGINVNVTGRASQPQEASFLLSDPTESYFLTVSYTSSVPHQFSPGDSVRVKARFVYDEITLHYLLNVSEKAHGIWTVVHA